MATATKAFLYEGPTGITEHQADWIRRCEYRYFIELLFPLMVDRFTATPEAEKFWKELNEWENSPDGLVMHTWSEPDDYCPGSNRERSSHFVSYYQPFITFNTAEERERFMKRFGQAYRINGNPFKATVICLS